MGGLSWRSCFYEAYGSWLRFESYKTILLCFLLCSLGGKPNREVPDSAWLALLSLIHPRWLMPKSVPTTTTPIAIYYCYFHSLISDFANTPSPAPQDIPFTTWTVCWTIFSYTLDIGQFQDNNRHGRLSRMAVCATTILHRACHFILNQPVWGQSPRFMPGPYSIMGLVTVS